MPSVYPIRKETAGPNCDELEPCVFGDRASVTDDLGPILEVRVADFGITTDAVPKMPQTLIGDTDALAEKMLLEKERCGMTYRIIQGTQMEAMAPLIKAIAGR